MLAAILAGMMAFPTEGQAEERRGSWVTARGGPQKSQYPQFSDRSDARCTGETAWFGAGSHFEHASWVHFFAL